MDCSPDVCGRDTFIYEYVGDVVNPVSFKKRMREYGEEGIQHFYFMMLQKDEVRPNSLLFSLLLSSADPFLSVYRCDKKWRDRTFRKPQLQSKLLRRQVDRRKPRADGNIC